MTRVVVQVRCHDSEKRAWLATAGDRGLSAWVRRALNDQVALEAAEAREQAALAGAPGVVSVPVSVDLAGKFKPDPRG